MSCENTSPSDGPLLLPSCIPMSDATFGVLTSALTVGGLIGSLIGAGLSDRLGRKGASVVSTSMFLVGALAMAGAWTYPILLLGRLVIGIASGSGLVVVPIMLSEMAAPNVKGAMGTLNQLSIVAGILLTQCVGLVLARESLWRYVLVIAAGFGAVQLLTSSLIYDTPVWLEDQGREQDAKRAAQLLWGEADLAIGDEVPEEAERQPLFDGENSAADDVPATPVPRPPATFKEVFTSPALRRPLMVTLLVFFAQQGSGINAVMYYSTSILGRVVPDLAGYISILIAAVINAVMTFPPVFLIDRVGKRTILQASIVSTLIFGVLVAVGLNAGQPVVTAVGIVGFVAAFAAGLGPVPYVITAQTSPYFAVSTLSSIGLILRVVAVMPPPPPPPRRQRRNSLTDSSQSDKPHRPKLGPAPPPPETRQRNVLTQSISTTPISPIINHPSLPTSPLSPPASLSPELELGLPPIPPMSDPRSPSPEQFPLSLSPSSRPPPLPPPPADPPPHRQSQRRTPSPIVIPPPRSANPASEAASLQGIPYPSEDMFLDSENLSTLEKIFLFANSDAAYHRLFVARTLPEWLPTVDPHEAVEYILPLLNGLGTDSEDTVRETFAPSLARVMWYFFITCTLTEEEQPLTPSAHSEDHPYPAGPPVISVSSFTPLLGSLLLNVNRSVQEFARWGVVQVLQKLKDEEESETALPAKGPLNRRKAKEAEKEKAKKWEGWWGGAVGKEKRDMIRRELILGVVLGMARLEEDEGEAEGYDRAELDELSEATRRERASERGDWEYEHGEDGQFGLAEGWEHRTVGLPQPGGAAGELPNRPEEPEALPELPTVNDKPQGDTEELHDVQLAERGAPDSSSGGKFESIGQESGNEESEDTRMTVQESQVPDIAVDVVDKQETAVPATEDLEETMVSDALAPEESTIPAIIPEAEAAESTVSPFKVDTLPSTPQPSEAEDHKDELLDKPRPVGSALLLAEGTTTFLLHCMSPKWISLFALPTVDDLVDEEEDLPIPGGFSLRVAPSSTSGSGEASGPFEAKQSPSPLQQSDEDTPAMTIDASPSDNNDSPAVAPGETPANDKDEDEESGKIDAHGIIELVAQASELGMATMSPDQADAVSPLYKSEEETPGSPSLIPSDSEATVKNRISPNPPSDDGEDMDIVQEDEEEEPMDIDEEEQQAPPPATGIVISPPLEAPMPPEYFPSPPVNFPPPQPTITPNISPDWLPVPPQDAAGPAPHELPGKSSPLALIAALALMSAIASSAALPPVDLESHFLPELLRIASQADEWVRREAGFVIGALAKAVSPDLVRADLVPLLLQFSSDPFWHVRHSSLFSAPPILSRLQPQERYTLGLQIFLAAASDPSRAVRNACLELLGEAIATFKDDASGPPEELVQLFLGDPNNRPEDTDSDPESPLEWLTTPGLGIQPVPTTRRDTDRCLVCAFNFPAVALTLGKDRWPQLRDYYLYLARDKSLKVRRTLASSLGALAEIIGPEAARQDLVHVWKRSFEATSHGFVDEDVVGWAIESIEGLLKTVGGDFPREVVQLLRIWWSGIMARRWRLREQLATKLPSFAQSSAHVEGVPEGLRTLLGLALTDDVAAVRESAAEGVSEICAALRGGPGEEAIRQELLHLSEHPSFRNRMTFVACIQSLLADEMKDDLYTLWPRVWALGTDPVVDVRISVARLVASAVGMGMHPPLAEWTHLLTIESDNFFRDTASRPLNALIRRLIQDKSYQVRSFVAFLRGTHTVTPVTTPVRGASLMSPSAKFSRPPLVLSPSGSVHDEPVNYVDDHIPGMDDTKEFSSAIARGRDVPLPVFRLPSSPRHSRKVEPISVSLVSLDLKPAEEVVQGMTAESLKDAPEAENVPEEKEPQSPDSPSEDVPRDEEFEEEDLDDPFADSMDDDEMEEGRGSLDSDGDADM
ncbi:hypothetical protein DACRYDRAFT_18146 [Dacryopinax primogenitus]|uniref:Major facilitator superfamily (MFS) profile domain-containing protein n=1 Tax=Dacryopinax primogenitus (strain DJM 731) TaxID=1858805 RepID=M5FS11_DACPD|nr:uncharacterized protein DACRYDRAFT_18146 [Dacryopinax primogenitus]EJT98563.1 hypothetical protein DACRYDRAFT_18146 [Dacryopinax primogenitus]